MVNFWGRVIFNGSLLTLTFFKTLIIIYVKSRNLQSAKRRLVQVLCKDVKLLPAAAPTFLDHFCPTIGADQNHLNEDQKDGNDDDDCIVCCHMGETPRCHLSLGNPFHDQSNAKIVH